MTAPVSMESSFMDSLSHMSPEDRRRFAHQLLAAANEKSTEVREEVREEVPMDITPGPRDIRAESKMSGDNDIRPPPPTWSVANAKDVKPPPEVEMSPREPAPQISELRPEPGPEPEPTNGLVINGDVPGEPDAHSDIDEILAGGDAEPEPPRYDGDFDQERHDYWWNLLDLENPRHARASKGMRYGTERNPRCETCERQNRACMTRPNSHDRTGCVRCSYTQSGCSHAREARESHQQKTGWPKPVAGSVRKRDDGEEDGSYSPHSDSVTKRPRLSSFGIPMVAEARGLATPSRSGAYDVPSVNGRHYSPHLAPGSGSVIGPDRVVTNGDSSHIHDIEPRRHEYYETRPDSHRRDERSYYNHDRCESQLRESNKQVQTLMAVVEKLQREVRVVRSRLEGLESRVNNISGLIDY